MYACRFSFALGEVLHGPGGTNPRKMEEAGSPSRIEKEDNMESVTLATALEREHREIDGGIEAYTAGLATGTSDTGPLLRAMNGLRRHIYLEEEFLFPPLRAGGLMVQLFVMVREHGELWKTMEALDASLAGTRIRCAAGSLHHAARPARQAQHQRGTDHLPAGRHGAHAPAARN